VVWFERDGVMLFWSWILCLYWCF